MKKFVVFLVCFIMIFCDFSVSASANELEVISISIA